MNGAMVRATVSGSKTQTRRVVTPQPIYGDVMNTFSSWMFKKRNGPGNWLFPNATENVIAECPFGVPGDRLWIRETFLYAGPGSGSDLPSYREERASPENHIAANCWFRATQPDDTLAWTPSIHMPRWASRITLEVTGVRVERLQNISEEDALAEGVEQDAQGFHIDGGRHFHAASARESYSSLWDSLAPPAGSTWADNPWVWVVEFKRVSL
jgi:hypothetical protein